MAIQIAVRIDVGRIRRKLRHRQPAFAARFGFSIKNMQNREQGSRQPEGRARGYFLLIDRNSKKPRVNSIVE